MIPDQLPTALRIEVLKDRIRSAFAGVPMPARDLLAQHDCDECEGLRSSFGGRHWQTLDEGLLKDNFDNLPLLSPEGLGFYLPAYLLYALDHLDPHNDVTEFTIYHLAPDNTSTDPDYYRDRLRPLTQDQFDAIDSFTQLVLEDEDFRRYYGGLALGRQRLKEYWLSRWS